MYGNDDRDRSQPPMMPLPQPPPRQLPDPRPPQKPKDPRRFVTVYYIVVFTLFGFPALVNLAYGAPQWAGMFFFVFLVFAGGPLLFMPRRRPSSASEPPDTAPPSDPGRGSAPPTWSDRGWEGP